MTSVWLLPVIVICFGFLSVVGMVIFGVWINRQTKKIDVRANAPLIDSSSRRQFTGGYSLGLIKNETPRKNGTVLMEFYPIDSEQGEDQPRPELQSVVVAKQFVKRFARGEYSSRREAVRLISRNPADLPEKMRGTIEGTWETKEGQLAYLERVFGKSIPAGDEAIHEQVLGWSRGNISRATMAQIKEETMEFRKSLLFAHPESSQDKKSG